MNTTEMELITTNRVELVHNTECNTTFLATFSESGVLSAEDVETIEVQSRNEGRYRAAQKFYDLLLTRTNSYVVLIQALRNTNQSGALQILGCDQTPHDTVENDSNLAALNPEGHVMTSGSQKYACAPSYMEEFLKNVHKTILIILSDDCSVTSERILETVQNCESYNVEEFKQFLKDYRFHTHIIPVVIFQESMTNIVSDAYKRNIKCVMIFPSNTEQVNLDTKNIVSRMPKEKVSLVQDNLEWAEFSPDFQTEIYFKLNRDLKLSKSELEEAMNKLDYSTLVRIARGDIPQLSSKNNDWSIFKNNIPEEISYYIPKQLVSRNLVGYGIFVKECNDIFLFSKTSKNDLNDIFGLSISTTTRLIEQAYKIDTRFFLLVETEHFPIICRHIRSRPIHLLQFCDGNFLWKQSRGKLDSIQQTLIEKQSVHREKYFIEKMMQLEEGQRLNVCISDTPGMGKSVLLGSIARQLQEKMQNQLVSLVEIGKLVKQVKHLGYKPSLDNNIIHDLIKEAVYCCLCANEIGKVYLGKHPVIVRELLLDGFDELDHEDEELGYRCLKYASLIFPKVRVWVATRPHMLQRLENVLEVMGNNIQPFDEDDQVNFLTSFWKRSSNELIRFAKERLNDIKTTLDAKEKDIAGIPLQCLLIAEVYEDTALQFLDASHSSQEQGPEMFTPIEHMIELYAKLVEKKLDKFDNCYTTKVKSSNWNKFFQFILMLLPDTLRRLLSGSKIVSRKDLINAHIHLSLELLLPVQTLIPDLNLCSQNISFQHFVGVGLLEAENFKSPLQFVHRTFAEYFLALFTVDILMGHAKVPDTSSFFKYIFQTQTFDVKLSSGVFVESNVFKFSVVCYFINALLRTTNTKLINMDLLIGIQDSSHVKACATSNYENIFSLIYSKGLSFRLKTQKFKEDLLFISVYQGCLKMLEMCRTFKLFHDSQIVKMRKRNFTLLHFAVSGGDFQTVKYLCTDGKFSTEYIIKNFSLFENLVNICISNTKAENRRQLDDRLEILRILTNLDVFLLKFVDQEGIKFMKHDHVHVNLKNELFQLIIQDESTLKSLLHQSIEVLTMEEYMNLLKTSLVNKCKAFQSKVVNSNLTMRSLLYDIIKKTQPTKDLLDFLLTMPTNFNEQIGKVSLFEFAIRWQRNVDCLLWLARNVNLSEENAVHSSEYLFRYYFTTTVITIFTAINPKPSSRGVEGNTFLHMLMSSGGNAKLDLIEINKFLIELGVDVNTVNINKETPLHVLAKNQGFSIECWHLLIKNNASVKATDCNGQNPISRLLHNQKDLLNDCNKFWKFIMPHDSEIALDIIGSLEYKWNNVDNCRNTFLHTLLSVNFNYKLSLTIIEFLINMGISVNAVNIVKETPLHVLIKNPYFLAKYQDIWNFLVKFKADIFSQDVYGNIPISHLFNVLSTSCHIENVLKNLNILNVTSCQELKDPIGNFLLHYAATTSNLDIFKCIFDYSSGPNILNNKNQTPLHIVAMNVSFSLEIWKYLVTHGANVFAKDTSNKTPISKLLCCYSEDRNKALFAVLNNLDIISDIEDIIWLVISEWNCDAVKNVCTWYIDNVQNSFDHISYEGKSLLDATCHNSDKNVALYVRHKLQCTKITYLPYQSWVTRILTRDQNSLTSNEMRLVEVIRKFMDK